MIRVHSAKTLAELKLAQDHLAAYGIASEVRNQFKTAALGDLPWTETWPELWVADESDAARARLLLAVVHESPDPRGPPWRCPRCAESVDADFARCWNCEAERPA
ncbi:MAG: DUF2007 domain-containing protein [bacterium]